MASPTPETIPAPPGVVGTPSGPVPYIAYPATQDYPRLVYSAPRFEVVAIADIIQPSVLEAVEAVLPGLIPPYIQPAVDASIAAKCVQLVGSTMTGPLMLSPAIPTQPTMAATKQYVDTMVATTVPEVPPVPAGASWMRQTGQWVAATGGGTVTNIATGAGLTGGPITGTGTIAMANMAANSLKGNNTGAVASPVDLNVGQVMTMLGAAPLNSPVFTGSPSLPTGTAAITQPGGTSNTTVATTAFVGTALLSYAPIASPVFTGAPNLPTGTIAVTQTAGNSSTAVATTAFVGTALGSYLLLTGGTLAGPGNLTVRGGILGGAAGTVPGTGALTLNANTVAPASAIGGQSQIIGADGSNPQLSLDCYGGAGNTPVIYMRHARGTAAAPTATQINDYLLLLQQSGYYASAYAASNTIMVQATENWTSTTTGTRVTFQSVPTGTATAVNSLILQGNLATFSGNVAAAVGGVFSWGTNIGGVGVPSVNPFIYGDNTNIIAHTGNTGSGAFSVQTGAGTTVMTANGASLLAVAFACKPGSVGGPDGHVFNISYGSTGPAHLWIDTSDLGSINLTPCDMRLKKNLKDPSVDALGAINAIALKQFDWLANDLVPEHHEDIGFTAQQLHEAIPNAVYPKEDADEMWSVQLTPIVAHLIGAVQQLSTRLATLEGRA